ncbi:unnamed protein product [Aphanomyces euteiches]|uniref:60S ribosomal export protein NMD3 n=1 Tax=Aphanomyces euteiches TaxID=100861 RepID=A0A6G0XWA3_9STRA|nr:hypothetical protein Ae201684_001184 [Aphanomyces euteiches]KAH9087781.1 hypothetical protein LEN26_019805 [Aphanomyces euteiches]KAH9099931.1 hypothetical protein Ae201684P_018937 [Aphanomyces euteiches]KAH9114629.1 hypothetical protein AeMF1_011286 [Aphanomyces euteiches]KAH9156254.1 hypothetical protein AeRB84_001837 [Aphanomyces euteiches]
MQVAEHSLPDILCCICAVPIKANAANMCVSCLKGQVDVTEGIPKEIIMHQCRGCLKWSRPQWVSAELESRELLAICLKKITGLNKVKLVDAGWIWTEPHSKRLKLKLTVQKEVMNGAILQQSFIVTFIVRNQQCDECQASFTNHSWKAVVQVRQKVEHKRTFFYLEQLILKHRVHEKTTNIESQPDGVDFFFVERNHALRFVDFLQETVPISLKTAKKLISADNHSNTANYKFTYAVDIAPVCKDDLVALPLKLARQLGNISSLCLVTQVTSSIHVIDPFTMQRAEIENEKYWRYPFKALRSSKQLTEYTVLDSTPMEIPMKGGVPVRTNRKTRLAELEIVRNSDFGVNDTRFQTVSHLGMLLNVGDTAMGYDLVTSVFNDADTKPLDEAGITLPDVVLVRKQFLRRVQKRQRKWKLKTIEGIESMGKKDDPTKHDLDYEHFLNDLEQDKEMRSRINIYKNDEDDDDDDDDDASMEDGDGGDIPLDELLDDMTMEDQENGVAILTPEAANQTQSLHVDDL